jgi:predicted nuclease of predicted toxin-antitoxin system
MNLSPLFVELFQKHNIKVFHWQDIGDIKASDITILEYAKNHGYIILTHDLDFGAILAASKSKSPSVLQLRTQNILPLEIFDLLLKALHDFEKELARGALISIDRKNARVKILPVD